MWEMISSAFVFWVIFDYKKKNTLKLLLQSDNFSIFFYLSGWTWGAAASPVYPLR